MLEGPLELPPVAAALDALARAPEAFGPRLVAFCLEQSQRRSRRATKQEQEERAMAIRVWPCKSDTPPAIGG